jgi:hypothetical protein
MWQAAIVNGAKRLGMRHWLSTAHHPTRRDGAVLLALLLLPWLVALIQVRRHHHLDIGAVAIVAAFSFGLPTLWVTWAAYRDARRSDTPVNDLKATATNPKVQDTSHGQLGQPITDLSGPLALGVHKAVNSGDTRLPELPEYVPRDHDAQLRTIMERADKASMMIVLVGDSSTGKTRALWEALRYLPDRWRVWSPVGARALNEGLTAAGIGPRTVVWLDDGHNYLGVASQMAEDTAERLIGLMADPGTGPVLVAATLWPENWQQLTAQPRRPSGGAEGSPAYVPALLESATYIQVPTAFGPDDRAAASVAANHDPRIALALQHAPTGKITQYLAGAPKLFERYQEASPEAKAIIDAAVDARRFGHGDRLPERLLLDAAPGYLDSDTWDQLRDGWTAQALQAVTEDWRGLPGPLTRIRPRPGETPVSDREYKLADVLEQAGTRDRRYVAPPQAFWTAATSHAHTENLAGIGYAAQTRSRRRDAVQLYAKGAAADDVGALHELALMHEEAGDHTGAERMAAKAALAGDCDALKILGGNREVARDYAAAERLFRLAVEAGDKEVVPFLPQLLEQVGNHSEAERLSLEVARSGDTAGLARIVRTQAKARNYQDAERLALEALAVGDPEPLSDVAGYRESDGNRTEAERLYRRAASHGNNYALAQLIKMLENDGNHAGADRLAHEAAQKGNPSALRVLACKRLGVDDLFFYRGWEYQRAAKRLKIPRFSDAKELLQQAADIGDGTALGILAQFQVDAGDYDQASQLAIRAAEARNTLPLRELAQMRADAGEDVQAEQLARKAAAAGDADALNIVARIREAAGDHAEADRLAIQAALADEHWALDDIVEQREQAGDREGAERLALDAAKATHVERYESFTFTRQPISALRELIWIRLSREDHAGAERLAVKAAGNGYTDGLTELAEHRHREGAYEDAQRLYELAADFGDADALVSLAAMLKEARNFIEAERFYQQAINGASRSALRGLASLWEETGNQESARRSLQYGLDAEGNAASPWTLNDTDDQS